MIEFVFAFLLALAASLVLTPVVRKLASSFGFVDRPDGGRKAHERPVALGGGAAVLLATLVAIGLTFGVGVLLGKDFLTPHDVRPFAGLLIGAFLVVLLGLADDIVGLRGRYKLVGQLIIAGFMAYSGFQIHSVSLFERPFSPRQANVSDSSVADNGVVAVSASGSEEVQKANLKMPPSDTTNAVVNRGVALGLLAIPFTLFWFVGVMNAINLIDGIDGLASSVGFVLCLTIAAIAAWKGNMTEAIIMLALAGALLGFLRYNFAPASIYLGDAGSMLIGLVIGTIAIHSSIKSATTVALAVPCAVWCIPILDSLAALLRRKLTGRSFFAADRGHLHHSLLVRGWSVRQAVLFIGLICATTCLSALLSVYFRYELIALLTVFAVIVFLIVTQTFGHIEFALLKNRFRFTLLPLSGAANGNTTRGRESRLQLQGARPWEKLWMAMIESAEDYRLVRLKLIIHIPALHEDYFASWDASRDRQKGGDRTWRVAHPLIVNDEIVGHVEVAGMPGPGSTLGHMIQVLDFLEPIEEDVQHIMERIQHDQPTVRLGKVSSIPRRAPSTVLTQNSSDALETRPAVASK